MSLDQGGEHIKIHHVNRIELDDAISLRKETLYKNSFAFAHASSKTSMWCAFAHYVVCKRIVTPGDAVPEEEVECSIIFRHRCGAVTTHALRYRTPVTCCAQICGGSIEFDNHLW